MIRFADCRATKYRVDFQKGYADKYKLILNKECVIKAVFILKMLKIRITTMSIYYLKSV